MPPRRWATCRRKRGDAQMNPHCKIPTSTHNLCDIHNKHNDDSSNRNNSNNSSDIIVINNDTLL